MKQLSPNRYECVRKLFSDNYPNLPLIFSIIEGLIPGEIWVDNDDEPNVSMVITGAPYCFISGEINEKIFEKCFKILSQKPVIKLVLNPQPKINISELGFVPVSRRQYRYTDTHNKIPIYTNHSGFLIKKIDDAETFNLCIWKSLMTDIFGSVENYLKNGIGFILWDEDKHVIASESHGIPSKEFIEVGSITNENYRRQKLSTILCNHLISYALKKELKPVWSCDDANFISWKVAEKQGMDNLIRYTFHTWTK